MAKDPVGFLADASAVLSGGGALASKVPGLAKAAEISGAAGRAVNPLSVAGRVTAPIAKVGGKVAANVIGGIGTHTGAESISQAAKAGFRGGEAAKSFQQNLRGNVPITNVLEDARANLNTIKADRSAMYRSGMLDISKDKSVLDLKGIQDSIKSAKDSISYKGQVKDPRASKVVTEMQKEVNRWSKLNPSDYHTPEGLDALKQKLSSVVEKIPYEQSNARRVGTEIVNSVKSEIKQQAPTYSNVMKGYSQASDQIKELERSLVGTSKTPPDTALRKLQSVMRNNVNTNYGQRTALAKQLEQQGGREIMPALAGQSLSAITPRGIGNIVAGGTGVAGLATLNPALLSSLLLQSPRLMGEAAYYGGRTAKPISKISQLLSPYMVPGFEAGRLGLLQGNK